MDLSRVILGAESQSFTVIRSSGHFDAGGWVVDTEEQIPFTGRVSVARQKDLLQMDLGDRIQGAMAFHTETELNMTRAEGTSDVVVWHDQRWKILSSSDYSEYGYWRSVGVRM